MKAKLIKETLEDTFKAESLRFSDGVEFDTSGELRPEYRFDGWYVVGQGMLIPVSSEEEALEYIRNIKT